jgi:phosphatidylserine decarboxylase
MNVFSVHVNRAPMRCAVEWTRRRHGGFMNAIKAESGLENERVAVALRDDEGRPVLVNLVAGLIARRIVCPLKPGDRLERGERIGMIKFGSRVEVFAPAERFQAAVRLGQAVRAGETVLGEWT